jgi:hypothetical protein
MRPTRLLLALTAVNVVLFIAVLVQLLGPAKSQGAASVVRGRALEIVDERGRVRASLSVLPAGTSSGGVAYPETVLLRLITERGGPSVKLSASEQASSLSLAGPTGSSNTYVILESRDSASTLELRNENGHRQIIKP